MTYYLPPLSPPWYVGAVFVLGIAILAPTFLFRKRLSRLKTVALAVIGGSLAGLGTLGIYFSSFVTFIEFYIPPFFMSGYAALAAIPIGIALFELRRRQRGIYGALEVLGAAIAIVVTAGAQYATWSQRAIALLGAIYFVVRGLDNANEGKLIEKLSPPLGKAES